MIHKVVRVLKRIKKNVFETLNILWRAFCCRLPIKERVLFFTVRANGRLLENMSCVYEKTDAPKKIIAYMLPHSPFIKPKIYYYLLTSRVVVTDDYLRYLRCVNLREGQKVLQLWHACGAFKKFGLDAPSPLLSPREERKTHEQYTAVAVSSESCREHYASAFGIDAARCLPIGTPRTDRLLSDVEVSRLRGEVYAKHPELDGKKVYLYCPTFRDFNGIHIGFHPGIDWEALNSQLADDEVFIIRNHPIVKDSILKSEFSRVKDYSGESTPALTAVCDVMITDYSSVIFDAAVLGKPMVFYCPDIEEYDRDFYLDFPEDLPGEVVTSADELLAAARRAKENPPVQRLEAFKNEQMGACDGSSAQRAADLIMSWLS